MECIALYAELKAVEQVVQNFEARARHAEKELKKACGQGRSAECLYWQEELQKRQVEAEPLRPRLGSAMG
ncbi:MAG TPA: hypothetical protein DCQ32_11325 [Cyanobacteria bacterium UBA8156]|nr:hypothetical protein [Cyanobacteria bacterium UBA8156]